MIDFETVLADLDWDQERLLLNRDWKKLDESGASKVLFRSDYTPTSIGLAAYYILKERYE